MQMAAKSIGRRLWWNMGLPRKAGGRLWRGLLVYHAVSYLIAVHRERLYHQLIFAYSRGRSPSNGRYDIGEGDIGTDEVSRLNLIASAGFTGYLKLSKWTAQPSVIPLGRH